MIRRINMTEEQMKAFLEMFDVQNHLLEDIRDIMVKGYVPAPQPTPQPEPPPGDLPGADYPNPLYADRTKGIRRIEFIDKFKAHVADLDKRGKPKYHENQKGVLELIVVQQGMVFQKGDKVWCWRQDVPIHLGSQTGFEICSMPGTLIARNVLKVKWKLSEVEHQLP
jgi:hypothetical protein